MHVPCKKYGYAVDPQKTQSYSTGVISSIQKVDLGEWAHAIYAADLRQVYIDN